MSRGKLDPVIHPPNRLKICSYLAPLENAEFQLVREGLDVSESVLSKQASHLAEAGYLRVHKQSLNGRQRTWLSLTAKGRKAFTAHLNALRNIIDGLDEA